MVDRVRMFGIEIDALTMKQAIQQLQIWCGGSEFACRYVVTPNVDHVVKLQENDVFRAAYGAADMVVVDGKPVLLASRLLGKPLPEIVPGSDLCPALFDAANQGGSLRVFLFGAADGVAERAAALIRTRWPGVEVCGVYSPPMGFSADVPSNAIALEKINAVKPDVLLVGLGAPKQEIWVHAVRDRLQVKVALCVGATIDFLAGEKSRAPVWVRSIGMEWLYRALSEPKRLLGRYLHDAWVFPKLFIREWLSR